MVCTACECATQSLFGLHPIKLMLLKMVLSQKVDFEFRFLLAYSLIVELIFIRTQQLKIANALHTKYICW